MQRLPRAVPQALLSEVAPIVYDVDGAREACGDGELGRLVAPGDLAALRDAVQWMMDHPQERLDMGRAGRELCRNRFDARAMVETMGGMAQGTTITALKIPRSLW